MAAIRAELAAIEPARACCRAATRAGLGDAASGRARSPVVARLAVRLEDATLVGPGGATSRSEPSFEWGTAREHCRMAWLRGRFLARGSLSLADGRTHLEFVVPPDEAPVLEARLAETGLPVSGRLRRGRGVLTSKGMEQVLVFLRRLGASATVLDIESRLVTRQLHGHLNRVVNAEEGNIARSVNAATRQVRAIDALAAADGLGVLSGVDRAVAEARRAAPEATLADLAEDQLMSRARVQRALARIEAAAAAAGDAQGRVDR